MNISYRPKTVSEQPQLANLAEHAWNGACNVYALVRSLSECIQAESDPADVRENPAVKIILGQICSLVGESCGPSFQAIDDWKRWKEGKAVQTEPQI